MKKLIFYSMFLFLAMQLTSCNIDNNEFKTTSVSVKVKMNDREINVPLNYKIREQNTTERVFKELDLKLEFLIGNINDVNLLFPIVVKTDKQENIYILDKMDCKVKVFNSNGVFIRSYGRRGEGPGELSRPFDMDVSPNSQIIVTDEMKCVYFDNESSRNIKIKYMAYRVAFSTENSFCVSQGITKDFPPIEKYGIYDNKTSGYESIVDMSSLSEKPPFIFSLIGNITSYKNSIIYVPNYLNHFVVFDENGKIKYSSKTIDKMKEVPVSVIGTISGQIFSKAPDHDLEISLGCGIIDGKLWIVSLPGKVKYKKKIFDIYALTDGHYLNSYITDDIGPFMRIYLSSNRVYVIQADATIAVMKIL